MGTREPRTPEQSTEPRPRRGLRVRLWLACLGGAFTAGVGLGLVIGYLSGRFHGLDPGRLSVVLGWVVAASLVAAVFCAVWLDRGIVGRMRRLTRALAIEDARPERAAGLSPGWGELSEMAERLQVLLVRHRQLGRSADEYQRVQLQIQSLRDSIERWTTTERWEVLPAPDGPLLQMIEALNRGFSRLGEVSDQNQMAAHQVRSDFTASLDDGRESAVQAEHAFVEATALLTTVRELQRLTSEFQQAADAAPGAAYGAAAQAYEKWRAAAAGAIEDLIEASGQSVERVGAGLLRVQEIAEQVQVLSNRATLIALNAVLAGGRPGAPGVGLDALAGELKQLAREVRAATERINELSDEVERTVGEASERMRGVRERVLVRLEQAPPMPEVEGVGLSRDMTRLLERLRETIQDAATRGERLSAAGERASRAAEGLIRRLEDQARDLEGLVVRLSPTEPDHREEQS